MTQTKNRFVFNKTISRQVLTCGILTGWLAVLVWLMSSGCNSVNAQNQKAKNAKVTMPADAEKYYAEYLKSRADSTTCLTAAEFMRVYDGVMRHRAMDTAIAKRIYKLEREMRITRTVYGWPGATRNVSSVWR